MGKPQDCNCGANRLIGIAHLDTCPAWIPPYRGGLDLAATRETDAPTETKRVYAAPVG